MLLALEINLNASAGHTIFWLGVVFAAAFAYWVHKKYD